MESSPRPHRKNEKIEPKKYSSPGLLPMYGGKELATSDRNKMIKQYRIRPSDKPLLSWGAPHVLLLLIRASFPQKQLRFCPQLQPALHPSVSEETSSSFQPSLAPNCFRHLHLSDKNTIKLSLSYFLLLTCQTLWFLEQQASNLSAFVLVG